MDEVKALHFVGSFVAYKTYISKLWGIFGGAEFKSQPES
jgi:hypothetical protein